MYSIGIITAEQSLHNIMKNDSEMQKHCNVTYLPYSSLEHLSFLYQQNAERFDALLFSGSYPYHVVLERYGAIPRPAAFFSIADRDYYCLIAQLAVGEPGIDFRRVFFDAPEIPVDFETIFGSPGIPLTGSYIAPNSPYANAYQPSLEYYQSLWDSKQVDLIVTRFSSMETYLAQANIRHRFLFPSPESMLETFHGLIMRLTVDEMHAAASCVGLISTKDELVPSQQSELLRQLQSLNCELGNLFLIYEHGNCIELTTNISVLKELTQQYTVCPVTSFLKEHLDFPAYLGWGCAGNVIDAHKNAQRGVKEAMQSRNTSAYVVTADGLIIGPLSTTCRMAAAAIPDASLARLSQQSTLSPTHISKISALISQRGNNLISSEDLARSFGVTTRSASRILSKLEECGLASVQYGRQLNQRGRPAKIYQVNF